MLMFSMLLFFSIVVFGIAVFGVVLFDIGDTPLNYLSILKYLDETNLIYTNKDR